MEPLPVDNQFVVISLCLGILTLHLESWERRSWERCYYGSGLCTIMTVWAGIKGLGTKKCYFSNLSPVSYNKPLCMHTHVHACKCCPMCHSWIQGIDCLTSNKCGALGASFRASRLGHVPSERDSSFLATLVNQRKARIPGGKKERGLANSFFPLFLSFADIQPSVLDLDLVLLLWPPIITTTINEPKTFCNYFLKAAIALLKDELAGSSLG